MFTKQIMMMYYEFKLHFLVEFSLDKIFIYTLCKK